MARSLTISFVWRTILNGNDELVDQMVRSGLNVNEPIGENSNFGHLTTMLHLLAAIGSAQRVRLLLNHGANCHARDSKNRTPLHWAVSTIDNPDVVEELISKGADVNALDDNQFTPLHHAVMIGLVQSVHKLVAKGALLNAVDARGWTVLHMASLLNNSRMIVVLTSYLQEVDVEDSRGWTPLHFALSENKTDIVHHLLMKGANGNKKTREGKFPLYVAAMADNSCALRLILKWGAHVNATTNDGNTALHVACENGYAQVAAVLLEFGADINVPNHQGMTPLEMLANKSSSEATARIIIREAIKREALGQPLCEGYKNMTLTSEKYMRFDQECREEIEQMRTTKIDIGDSRVSVFYIFSQKKEKLAALVRNEEIFAAIQTTDYLDTFRIYAVDINDKIEMARQRGQFLMSAENYLSDVFHDILPVPIVHHIAKYLEPGNIIT